MQLQSLHLSNCNLAFDAIFHLASALATNNTLRILKLDNNPIANSGATALGQALRTNSTLRELSIAGCGVQDEGIEEIIDGKYRYPLDRS